MFNLLQSSFSSILLMTDNWVRLLLPLAIVNEAAVNTLVQVFLKMCISIYFG